MGLEVFIRMKGRALLVLVVLCIAFAQLVTAAHGEDAHEGDDDDAHCAICFLASVNDDVDAPPAVADFLPITVCFQVTSIPTSQTLRQERSLPPSGRGPPRV